MVAIQKFNKTNLIKVKKMKVFIVHLSYINQIKNFCLVLRKILMMITK